MADSPLKITRESLRDGSMLAQVRARLEAQARELGWTLRSEAELDKSLQDLLAQQPGGQDIYVFGYGSLMWNPAFHHQGRHSALLHGWHRRYCFWVMLGRGTPETPGLMLALDRGGACRGIAYRIPAAQAKEELALLWRREMFGGAYHARWVDITIETGIVKAITFVINRLHPRYVARLEPAETAAVIARAGGELGTCRAYFDETVAQLRALGVRDSGLERIRAFLPASTPPL
jgi:cation transport protein ChaC